MSDASPLSPDERNRYEWQLGHSHFGEAGQQRLKQASVLVSRIGGLGGCAAYQLAAAGVGKLVLAHGGNVRPGDLNRQLLMTSDWLGKPRVESAARRLRELNPLVEVVAIGENINEENAARLVAQCDVVVDCAPLFTERFLLNSEAVRQRKPMVDAAIYEFTGQLTSIVPGKTPCLACLLPQPPEYWRRQFPVFGAVAGALGCLAAVEAIKLISGCGEPLLNTLLTCDFRTMEFLRTRLHRSPQCPVCGACASAS